MLAVGLAIRFRTLALALSVAVLMAACSKEEPAPAPAPPVPIADHSPTPPVELPPPPPAPIELPPPAPAQPEELSPPPPPAPKAGPGRAKGEAKKAEAKGDAKGDDRAEIKGKIDADRAAKARAEAAKAAPKVPLFPVWYATDRRIRREQGGTYVYENASIPGTRYGRADVEVPEDLLNKLRRLGQLQIIAQPMEAGVRMRPPRPMPEQVFFAALKDHIGAQRDDERDVLLYVHGFKTTFEDAIRRSAVLGFNLKVATTSAFVWASRGEVAAYPDDQRVALANVERLANHIVRLAQSSGATQMHVIAHSMGNEILLRAVSQPQVRALTDKGFRFGQIILAAPDVDKAVFASAAKAYQGIARRVTLYATANDGALLASATVMNGFPRAGTLPPVRGLGFIDTVDVGQVDFTALHHAALVNSIAVLQDMYLLITTNLAPRRRQNVFPVKSKDGDHWRLQ